MKTTPMMKCGHAANAINKKGEPCCVICIGIHSGASVIDEHPASLENRQAECAYCQSKVASSPELAFFESCPDKPLDRYYCGCKGWD